MADPLTLAEDATLDDVERYLRAEYTAAGLDPDEMFARAAANVARWQAMTPAERQAATDAWEAEHLAMLGHHPDITGGELDDHG